MGTSRRWSSRKAATALAAAGLAAVGPLAPAPAQADTVVAPGDPLIRSGTGCLLPDGAPGLVLLSVPVAGAKFRAVGEVPAAADGSWTFVGTVPFLYDGRYELQAACARNPQAHGAFPLAVSDPVLLVRTPVATSTVVDAEAPETAAAPVPLTRPRPVTARPRFTG